MVLLPCELPLCDELRKRLAPILESRRLAILTHASRDEEQEKQSQRRKEEEKTRTRIRTNAINDRWTGRGETRQLLVYHPVSAVG